jgi:hypothetical protein
MSKSPEDTVMNRMQMSRSAHLVLVLILSLCAVSCGGGSKKNPVNGDGNGNDNQGNTGGNNSSIISGVWSANDLGILDSAESRFDILASSTTPDQARKTLVSELASKPGVAGAKLFEDGYTIMVKFADGTYGAVNTLDYNKLNASASGYSGPPAAKRTGKGKRAASAFSGKRTDIVFDNIPSTKKILFLNISQPDLPHNSTAIAWVKNSFLKAGWDIADIIVKTRATKTSKDVMPEDFFELEEYGTVFIFAHGIFGSFNEGDPARYYLQLGSANTTGSTYADKLEQAAKTGQIIICDGDYYMRTDLVRQVLKKPENGMIFLVGSRGNDAAAAFLDKMSGRFYGWDDVPLPIDSYRILTELVNRIVTSNPVKSDNEIYFDDTLKITSVNPDGRTTTFQMTPTDGHMYFPAWINVSIESFSAPRNAADCTAGVQIQGKLVLSINFSAMSGKIDMVPPGEANCFAHAMKKDGSILHGTVQLKTIVTGENNIKIGFNKQIVYGVVKRSDYPTDDKFHPMSARCTAAHIWKKIDMGRKYVAFTTENYRFEFIEPVNISNMNLEMGGYCFNREQIEALSDSVRFEMGSNELARVEQVIYSYNPNDSEEVKKVNGYWEDIKYRAANEPWEVFPN